MNALAQDRLHMARGPIVTIGPSQGREAGRLRPAGNLRIALQSKEGATPSGSFADIQEEFIHAGRPPSSRCLMTVLHVIRSESVSSQIQCVATWAAIEGSLLLSTYPLRHTFGTIELLLLGKEK
ncbi:hypothetical protein ISCGN_001693 [Ixodes scapularis]